MKPISLKVRAIKGNKIMMSSFYNGTFSLTFSKRSPFVEKQKFSVGDKFQMFLSRPNAVITNKGKPKNRSRRKN